MIAGGEALRSITVTVSSGAVLVGSAGSIFVEFATSAIDSSGATATLCGGACQLPGAAISAITFGGVTPRLMTVAVSGGGFRTTVFTPSTCSTLLSFEDT